jgi:DNA-binding NarL/FixJ family response regulator
LGQVSSKDLEYKIYTLGDIGVIELLISYRYKYDENYFLDDSIAMAVSGAARLNEEVITTYATLDQLIKQCRFTEQQHQMIKLVGDGYSHEDMAEVMSIRQSTIAGRLTTIYKKIEKENEWQWKKCLYVNKLDLKTKRCSKCEEDLPATVEFYSPYDASSDGFFSYCRKCR